MAQQSEKTKNWCIGRFMVTLPANAEIKMERDEYYFRTIESKKELRSDFDLFVKNKEKELGEKKHRSGLSLLRKKVNAGERSVILAYWDDYASSTLAVIDGFRFIKNREIKLSSQYSPEREDSAISSTAKILKEIRYRDRSEIPSTPGFCIDYGFIPDEGYNNEKLNVSFVFKGQPDMHLHIDTLIKEPGPTLLARTKDVLSSLGPLAGYIHAVRSGKRALGPLAGEESLVKVPTEGGNVGHQFTWETQGEDRSDYPFISIVFETALKGDSLDGRPSSLNDRQALELWDSLLSSFRLRPTSKP